jgi:hypothetical protein
MLWNVYEFGYGKERNWGSQPLNVTTVIGHPPNLLGDASRGADFGGVPLRSCKGGNLWQKKSPRRHQMGYWRMGHCLVPGVNPY